MSHSGRSRGIKRKNRRQQADFHSIVRGFVHTPAGDNGEGLAKLIVDRSLLFARGDHRYPDLLHTMIPVRVLTTIILQYLGWKAIDHQRLQDLLYSYAYLLNVYHFWASFRQDLHGKHIYWHIQDYLYERCKANPDLGEMYQLLTVHHKTALFEFKLQVHCNRPTCWEILPIGTHCHCTLRLGVNLIFFPFSDPLMASLIRNGSQFRLLRPRTSMYRACEDCSS